MRTFVVNYDLSRFYASNSDFYSEIQDLSQILLISEEKFGGLGLDVIMCYLFKWASLRTNFGLLFCHSCMRHLTAEELLTRQIHEELFGGGTLAKTTSKSQVHLL